MKSILFVIDSLGIGGAEKSLITLLNCIDYTKYKVNLLLFSRGGAYEKYIPQQVCVLEMPQYLTSAKSSIIELIKSNKFRFSFSRLKYSLLLRLFPRSKHTTKAMLYWQSTSNCFNQINTKYDVAIAYGQGAPTFFVSEKINANKKIAWINAILFMSSLVKRFNLKRYSKFDHIVSVSESSKINISKTFSSLNEKVTILNDLIDERFIQKMAEIEVSVEMRTSSIKILTVARLDNGHKGYDIALEVCNILHKRGVDFKWYAVGDGGYRNDMIHYIEENNLQEKFILLGAKVNPYPYFKACDLYVQTSRHEGFGLSIAEARILNKPVVTTEFDAVWNQMIQGKNGIVVPIDATAVADAIQDLIENPDKMNAISDYQRTEKKGNIEELQKFYQLIES